MNFTHPVVRIGTAALLVAAVAGCCVFPPYGRGRGYYHGGEYRYQDQGDSSQGRVRGNDYPHGDSGQRGR